MRTAAVSTLRVSPTSPKVNILYKITRTSIEYSIGEIDSNRGFIEPTSFTDPLADDSACVRDLPYLKDLGVKGPRRFVGFFHPYW